MVDRVAVVTGGAGGIGRGLAAAAAARGMSVMLADVDETRLDETRSALASDGSRVAVRTLDVTDRSSMAALADSTLAEFGRVDTIFLNAGLAPVQTPFARIADADWDRIMRVNVDGVRNGILCFLPLLEEAGGGHINATASVNGHLAEQGIGAYNVSKFAVVAMMETLHVDLAREGSPVSASCLCPGPIATDLLKRAVGVDQGTTDEEHRLLNRGMDPEEVGRITFEAIDEGRFWVFTHPVMVDKTIRARFDAMADLGQRPIDLDWPWSDILREEL